MCVTSRPDGSASVAVEWNNAKVKYPSIPPMFPKEFYPQVGLVALSWGRYEVIFNRLLAALVKLTGDTSEPDWKFLDYKRRRGYCRRLVNAKFRVREKLKMYLIRVLDDSAVAHNKRNLIIHGKVECKLDNRDPKRPVVALRAEGRVARKTAAMEFTIEQLEDLAYEIMHIAGRINLSRDSRVQQLSSSDTRVLAELLSLIPPEESILPTLPFPP